MMLIDMGKGAKKAARQMALASTEKKNHLLTTLADLLVQSEEEILAANRKDIEEAKKGGMSEAMLDRLVLEGRLEGIAEDLRNVAQLEDPVGESFDSKTLSNGLKLIKKRTPIGVLGVIYESRPNVTVDVASLAIKAGNSVILRGGSETLRTNKALVSVIHKALEACGLPPKAVQLIESSDRALVKELLRLHDFVDMIIPRGGAGLHSFCRENSAIPVITGGIGICHLFVDDSAKQDLSCDVILNAKVQRPTVCNALDTVLVHEKIAAEFLPGLIPRLLDQGVKVKLDPKAMELHREGCQPAGKGDWDTEWLSLVLGIKVVAGYDEAVEHIQSHTTGHSDGILTEAEEHAEQFVSEIDSAAVYVNASTRFTDGSQFGLGAEVAISTQKLHARGPMALRELTTYKWVIHGQYHTR